MNKLGKVIREKEKDLTEINDLLRHSYFSNRGAVVLEVWDCFDCIEKLKQVQQMCKGVGKDDGK